MEPAHAAERDSEIGQRTALTASIAKLANLFRSQSKKVVLGAGDTFRAAAVEQLTIWADRLGVEIVKGEKTSAAVAEAVRALLARCGKVPVVVKKDRPGQLGNRLQMALTTGLLSTVSAKPGISARARCTNNCTAA